MADLDLLLEAERRGLLPADKLALLNEARSRGLVGGTPKPEETTSGFTGAFGAGLASLKGETALTGAKVASMFGVDKLKEAEEYRAKQEEEARKFKPTEKGWTEAPFEKLKELAGGSAAYMLAPVAAAGATALLPEAVAGAGITALGMRIGVPALASFATNTAQFTGSNIARQMDSDEGKKLADTSLLKAGATAIPQSLLDTGALAMVPGVRKILGQAGINIGEQAAEQIAKKGLLSTAGQYGKVIGKTAGVEGVTETGQAFLERLQAGLNLADPEARKEYYDNFIGGAVLGGAMGGAGHFYEKTFPGKEAPKQSTFEAPPPPTESKATEPLKLGYNPPVEDVVEKDPLQNPVGNFMPNELTPDIVKFVNNRRKEEGKPKLKAFSIEDLVEAGAPPQEVDRLLAYKNQFDGSVNLSADDVKNIAQQRNVDTETKGFTDFLRRATGQEDLTQMSQPQLHSAFVALNALDEAPELRVLPEGTNAVRFTDKQYEKGLKGVAFQLGQSPAIGRASVIQQIKDYTGLENDHDANVLLRTAIRNGDLEATRVPQFEIVNDEGKVQWVSNSKEDAKRGAEKRGFTVRDGFREEIAYPGETTQLPGGPDIRMGMFKEGDKPEGYEIKAGSDVLSVSNNETEANEKAERLSAVREQEAKKTQKKIEELGKKILASQNELERMEATGQGHSLEFAQLSASIHADNQAIIDETNQLKKDLNNYQQPVTVAPTKSVKPIVREGFTFFEDGAAVASFPTQQQAEEFALSRLDDEKLTNIVNVGPTLKGLMPKRLAKMAEAELASRGRTEPGVEVKFEGTEEEARERLAKLGIFSADVQDKVKELEKVLLPALRKLGLERVGLNIVRDIENNAEGNYSAGIIKIALDNDNHLGVLRHESLHALKELGAFTDKEWAVLNKQAKEKWVPQYMKSRTTEYGGKETPLYDAYKDIYQKANKSLNGFDEYIQEEAIAEAFRHFKPQAGMFGNIGYRIAQFFAALKNAFKRLGFQTADSVFEKIEAGKMRPKQEAAIKEGQKFSLRTISSLNTAFEIAKRYSFDRNKELKEVLQSLVNSSADKEGIDLKTYSDETKEHLAEVGLADALRSLKSNASAVGWYDRKVKQALAIVSLVHPEIATDPDAKFAFTWALAVTSNGQKVEQNFELAEKAYKYYKRYKKMPTNIKAGQAQKAINQSLKLFNEMQKAYGPKLLSSFMATEFTASQIEKATGIKVTGEFKDTKVLGAAILGPKIGNGFFSNLNGIFDRLTMDRWLMRTWGRWTGTLVEINQQMIEKKREELKSDLAKLLKNKEASAEIGKLLKQELVPIESDEQADALAAAIQKTSMLPENRKVLNKTDAGESIRKSGNALFKYLDGQKEAPNGPAERDAIRDVFKEILKGLHSQGYQDMTMSDLQALLWYPEKRLYDIAKDSTIEEDYTTEEAPDYANAAAKLARSKNVSNAKIQAEIKKVDEDYDNRAAAAKRGIGNGPSAFDAQGRVAPLNRKEYKRFLTRGILQSYRERNEKTPETYTRDSGRDGKGIRVLGVVAKSKYSPKTAFKNVMQEAGASVPAMYELQPQDADLFQDAIQASKDKNKFGAAVTVYPESEYAKMRLFIAEDGKAGFALKGNDIVSVFSEAPHVGASASMLQLAVQEGGRKLDAFDTVLPDLYFNAGFKIVSRTEFNEEFQPDGWDKKAFKDFNEGKPDVVFMVYDPNNTEVPSATAGRLYEDYDEAVKAQDEAVSDYKFPVKFKTEDKIYKPLEKQNAKEQAGPRYSLRPTEPSVRPSTGGGRGITLGERQEGAGTFSGIHYGKAKTERLSGGMFGSGIRGEESKRLAQSRDPRIKRRVYFYIPNDVGFVMRPEAGLGQHVYTQTFDNILPSGDEMSRLYRSVDKDFNAFESAVVDAGYDGYAVPSQGMMVILNHNVPVKYEGLAHELRAEGKLVNNKVKYSLRANLPASVNASVDATTTARDEKGFVERLLSAFNPETRAKLRAGFIFQFEAFERGTKARAARLGDQEYLADVSATAAALQSMQAKNIVEQAMRRGVPVYRNGFTTTDDRFKGLMEIFAPLGKTGDPEIWRYFQFYAAAKRGYRMKQEGRENLFKFDPATRDDLAEAQTLAATARAGGVDFDAVYREYQDWNEALVKFMKDTGVLSDADAAYYTKYGDYIPFYRQIDGEETIGPKIFSSFAGVQKPKAAKGGTAKLGDFLENVIRNASAAVESGMKNVAANRGIRDAVDSGTATQVNIASKDTVTVLEKGVKKFYELDDPLLFEAFKGLNVPRMPWLQILAKPADVLRNFVTKDPGFALANIMRDSVSAWVTSGSDMKPLVDSFKQAAKILANKSPEAVALAKAGLGGYEFKGNLEASAKAFEKALRAKTGTRTAGEQALLPFTKLWDMLEQGSNASDMATRAEIYKRVLAETGNEAEAVFQASEVMNFSRRGNFPVMQVLTAIVPFMNARIQGLDVLYRSGFGQGANANTEKMQKAFIVRSMAILGMTAAYWFMVHDDDEYKKLTKEERDGYWIVPGLKFNDKPFRFPIPFEIGVVFKVFPERIAEYIWGGDTEKDFAESITRNIVDTLKFNPIPQAVVPWVENITNHSFFTGEKIIGRGLENVAKPEQYTASTSLFARAMGDQFGVSPIQLENLIRGYTGTMGMYAVNVLDSFFGSQGDPVKATTRAEQLPVIKRFFASDAGTVAQYYDLKDEVDEVVRTVNFLSERDPERLEKYLTESNMNLYAMRGYVSTLDKHMKQIRTYKTAVNNDKSMSADEKRAILDELHKYEVDLTKDIRAIRKEYH